MDILLIGPVYKHVLIPISLIIHHQCVCLLALSIVILLLIVRSILVLPLAPIILWIIQLIPHLMAHITKHWTLQLSCSMLINLRYVVSKSVQKDHKNCMDWMHPIFVSNHVLMVLLVIMIPGYVLINVFSRNLSILGRIMLTISV